MSTTNIIAIAPASARADCNAVMEAMGLGPGSLGIPLTTDANAEWDDAPTHYGMSYQSAPIELQGQFLAATAGDLPPVPEGTVWGENGVIGAAAAMAAMAQLAVASFSDLFEPVEQLGAAMAAHDPVLHRIPEPLE